jgi:heme exporter protein A
LDGVELRRGGHRLVSDLSLTLEAGQLALITGPNGSGKTTLLRAIAGLSRPERGEIRVNGRPATAMPAEERGVLAYQGHLEGLKKDLTVEENIHFISQIRDYHSSTSSLMAELGLAGREQRSFGQLSAGQKRRAALAGLGVSNATIWVLDEPLTNLDQGGRDLVVAWIDRHLAAGGIVVVATHLAAALERPGCMLVEL